MFGQNYNPYGYNSYYPSYQQNVQQTMPQMGQMPQMPQPPKTNKIFVTGIEDALAKSNEPNSEYVYLHQDKDLIIEVKTDMQGKKTWQVFDFKPYVEPANAPEKEKKPVYVSKEEFDTFKSEMTAFINGLKKDEVVTNE